MSAINNPFIFTKNKQTTTYMYDVFGNLKELKTPSTTITYKHSPTHQIIAKKIDADVVEKYLWNDLKLLAVYDKDDKLKIRYFYANSRVPYKMIKDNKTYYIYYNQINSLKLITDKNGKIIKELDYDVYGNITKDTNKNLHVKIGFVGGFYDKDTKLVRFGKRDYNPEQRRWTALDPIGFEGGDLNLYGYVLNDPVSKVDPNGEKSIGDIIWEFFWGESASNMRKKLFVNMQRKKNVVDVNLRLISYIPFAEIVNLAEEI